MPALGVVRVLLFLVLLPVLAGCGEDGEELGASTPEALIEQLRLAWDGNDLGALVREAVPEDRAALATYMMVVMRQETKYRDASEDDVGIRGDTPGAEEARAALRHIKDVAERFDALLNRYGVDPRVLPEPSGFGEAVHGAGVASFADRMDEALRDVDVVRLAAEIQDLYDEWDERRAPEPIEVEPGSLAVDGDRAVVTFSGKPKVLKRINGRWYLSVRESNIL